MRTTFDRTKGVRLSDTAETGEGQPVAGPDSPRFAPLDIVWVIVALVYVVYAVWLIRLRSQP